MFTYHKYFVFATGIKKFRSKTFDTRLDAEKYMHAICSKYNIENIECYEQDKHARAYTNHAGTRFYINRVQ